MSSDELSIAERALARVGSTLKGKWTLDQLLGVGGMAAVYAATHRNGKRVAVKILHAEVSNDAGVRERFLREGYAANRVGHPGAVAVDDDDTLEDGCAFLVMELLEGETLEARILRAGKLSQAEVLSIADQTLGILVAAHEQEIVHRDIKPENVFVTQEGIIKLLDFGIARVRERSGGTEATRVGLVMGTPCYMPPEQARGRWEEVDMRSDLWALGATLFYMLTGSTVHQGGVTPNEILAQAVMQRARPIAGVDASLHPVVAALVDKALGYEKTERFQTAIEMRGAVRLAYAALAGTTDMPALSAPHAEVAQPPRAVTDSRLGLAPTLTTGRAVATSIQPEPPTVEPAPRGGGVKRWVVLSLGLAGLVGVLLASPSWFAPRKPQALARAVFPPAAGLAAAMKKAGAFAPAVSVVPATSSPQPAQAADPSLERLAPRASGKRRPVRAVSKAEAVPTSDGNEDPYSSRH